MRSLVTVGFLYSNHQNELDVSLEHVVTEHNGLLFNVLKRFALLNYMTMQTELAQQVHIFSVYIHIYMIYINMYDPNTILCPRLTDFVLILSNFKPLMRGPDCVPKYMWF